MANSICLAMMVKNEEAYIRRSLSSVKPFIDRWVVVDTGSTDGTAAVVAAVLGDLPGALLRRPWVDWGHNRTEAVSLARASGADFVFILDADEEVIGLRLPELDHGTSYWMDVRYGGIVYARPSLVSARHGWRYVGVTHEYLTCPEPLKREKLGGHILTDPARATKTPERCADDARLLEEALRADPDNARHAFYLAQSYKDSGQAERAIEAYEKRAAMGGWDEEVYIALLRAAQLKEGRRTFPEVAEAYTKAHLSRPARAGETLGNLARYCRWWADNTPYPAGDCLFISPECYQGRTVMEDAKASTEPLLLAHRNQLRAEIKLRQLNDQFRSILLEAQRELEASSKATEDEAKKLLESLKLDTKEFVIDLDTLKPIKRPEPPPTPPKG